VLSDGTLEKGFFFMEVVTALDDRVGSSSSSLALVLRLAAAVALLAASFESEISGAAAISSAAAAVDARDISAAAAAAVTAAGISAAAAAVTAAATFRPGIALPSASHSAAAASVDWGFVDKVVYINTAGAIERDAAMRLDFLPAFGKPPGDIIRLEAFAPDEGREKVLGTGTSHLAALQLAISGNFSSVLVLEDDQLWRVAPGRANLLLLEELAGRADYDVLLLGGTYVHVDEVTHRVTHAYSCGAYIVAGRYMATLAENFAESLAGLMREPSKLKDFSIDIYWTRLMRRDSWSIITPALAIQDHYASLYGYKDGPADEFVG